MIRRTRIHSHVFSIFVVLSLAVLAAPATAQSDGLTLKRVLLSTGGVGYFEYEAEVEGDAVLSLDVRLDQVDDVLKSVVVFDDAGGVGAIRLPGREPLAQAFRDLPFGPDAVTSPVRLLNALRGAEIAVSGSRDLAGSLIGVEPETVVLPNNGGTVTRHRVSVLTALGVQQFVLEEADAVRFADSVLRGQVDGALVAIARHRVRDRRTLVIEAPGDGVRTVRVGYVVGAPLWKASYRLSLDPTADQGVLQGWAVIENMSGQDWKDVELTLASGNPVTFRQALYTAYYVNRPEVPVEVLGRILPPADTGAVGLEMDVARAPGDGQASMRRGEMAGAMTEMAQAMDMAAEAPVLQAAAPPAPKTMASGAMAAVSEDAATQVVFRLAAPVSAESGQSLLVPIIDGAVPAQAVALYQPNTHARHPLAAVRLTNDTGSGLPPGVLTLYEQGQGVTYVGDAQLAPLPAGDARLLSFALDQKMIVDRETDSERTVASGSISEGVLRLRVRQRETTTYRLNPSGGEDRRVILEHPRRAGWELVAPDSDDVEMTETALRIPVSIQAGEPRSFEVTLEQPVVERISLIDLPYRRLIAFAESRDLDAPLRDAFARLAQLRAAVDRQRTEIDRLEASRQEIYLDQERLRDNLQSVPRDSDLHQRYLGKMTQQEDALDGLGVAVDEAMDALATAERALNAAISDLDI